MPLTSGKDDIRAKLGRLWWGFLGATLVVGPSLASWWDVKVAPNQLSDVKMVSYMSALSYALCWVATLYLAYKEPDPHWWNVFFRSVGVPGTLLSVTGAVQLSGAFPTTTP